MSYLNNLLTQEAIVTYNTDKILDGVTINSWIEEIVSFSTGFLSVKVKDSLNGGNVTVLGNNIDGYTEELFTFTEDDILVGETEFISVAGFCTTGFGGNETLYVTAQGETGKPTSITKTRSASWFCRVSKPTYKGSIESPGMVDESFYVIYGTPYIGIKEGDQIYITSFPLTLETIEDENLQVDRIGNFHHVKVKARKI